MVECEQWAKRTTALFIYEKRRVIALTIGEYIALRQPNIYRQLMQVCGVNIRTEKPRTKPKENYRELMRHDSFKRVGGVIKQQRWS